jgi:high-affinity nickel-transport protein
MVADPLAVPVSPAALLALGFALGVRHAADPDHLVAVTALVARTRRVFPAMRLGVCWGLGHAMTLFAVGGGIVAFRWVVPPRIGLALEFAVAIALVVVGLVNLVRVSAGDSGFGPSRPPARRAFAIGLIHGLAGSAAVALLVVATVRSPWLASVYLAVFSAGTILGMVVVTTALSLPIGALAARWGGARRAFRLSTGTLSLAFGLFLMWQIGWRDGLFLPTTHWSPH